MIYRKLYMDRIIPFIDTPFCKDSDMCSPVQKTTIFLMLQDELKSAD